MSDVSMRNGITHWSYWCDGRWWSWCDGRWWSWCAHGVGLEESSTTYVTCLRCVRLCTLYSMNGFTWSVRGE